MAVTNYTLNYDKLAEELLFQVSHLIPQNLFGWNILFIKHYVHSCGFFLNRRKQTAGFIKSSDVWQLEIRK